MNKKELFDLIDTLEKSLEDYRTELYASREEVTLLVNDITSLTLKFNDCRKVIAKEIAEAYTQNVRQAFDGGTTLPPFEFFAKYIKDLDK